MKTIWLLLFALVVTYQINNGDALVYWNVPVGGTPPTGYEVQVRGIYPTTGAYIYGTVQPRLNVPITKAGTFEILTRSVYHMPDGALVSAWCSSLDPNCSVLRNGKSGAWQLLRKK